MTTFEFPDWLGGGSNRGYFTQPIPQQRDEEISALLRSWLSLDPVNRRASAQSISRDYRLTLLAYSERMASLAVRVRDPELIVLGLLAVGIDGGRGDWRDDVLVISLHYDAAHRLNVDPTALFERVAAWLEDKPASALRSFLSRSEEDKGIDVMGYVADSDADGFRYRRTW